MYKETMCFAVHMTDCMLLVSGPAFQRFAWTWQGIWQKESHFKHCVLGVHVL